MVAVISCPCQTVYHIGLFDVSPASQHRSRTAVPDAKHVSFEEQSLHVPSGRPSPTCNPDLWTELSSNFGEPPSPMSIFSPSLFRARLSFKDFFSGVGFQGTPTGIPSILGEAPYYLIHIPLYFLAGSSLFQAQEGPCCAFWVGRRARFWTPQDESLGTKLIGRGPRCRRRFAWRCGPSALVLLFVDRGGRMGGWGVGGLGGGRRVGGGGGWEGWGGVLLLGGPFVWCGWGGDPILLFVGGRRFPSKLNYQKGCRFHFA